MKKIIIGLAIVVIVIILSLVIYTKIDMHGSLFCVKEGHNSITRASTNAFSNKYYKFLDADCCDGLIPISRGLIYEPEATFSDENGCVRVVGSGGAVCSNCGNNVCEKWENQCSCPKDCND